MWEKTWKRNGKDRKVKEKLVKGIYYFIREMR